MGTESPKNICWSNQTISVTHKHNRTYDTVAVHITRYNCVIQVYLQIVHSRTSKISSTWRLASPFRWRTAYCTRQVTWMTYSMTLLFKLSHHSVTAQLWINSWQITQNSINCLPLRLVRSHTKMHICLHKATVMHLWNSTQGEIRLGMLPTRHISLIRKTTLLTLPDVSSTDSDGWLLRFDWPPSIPAHCLAPSHALETASSICCEVCTVALGVLNASLTASSHVWHPAPTDFISILYEIPGKLW